MNIATLVMTHADPQLTAHTVAGVEKWVGERVLVLVDEAGWSEFKDIHIGGAKIEQGFLHAHNRSPYRNSALGLKKLYEYWPGADWFLYTEYDCLFNSAAFKADLLRAEALGAWCVGFDLRRFDFQVPLLETLLQSGPIQHSYFLLGCCVFLRREFLARLHQNGFIDRFLAATADFEKGTFPGSPRWAFEEELWPTLAVKLGGSVLELACWKGRDGEWQQRYAKDPHMHYTRRRYSKL